MYAEATVDQIIFSQEKEVYTAQNSWYDERERLFSWAALQANRAVDVVFWGDSITQKIEWADFFPGLTVANRGIGSDTTSGVLARLDSVIALKPIVVSCMIGINDIAQGYTTEEIVQSYQKIFTQLRKELPEVQIIVNSVLPVTKDHIIQNKSVVVLNQALSSMCEEENVTYLDIYYGFIDEEGDLRPEYALDMVHLTARGYAKWFESLVPVIHDALL